MIANCHNRYRGRRTHYSGSSLFMTSSLIQKAEAKKSGEIKQTDTKPAPWLW